MGKNFRVSGNQLTFVDQRFYFNDQNQFVPSVSTILEAYPKGPEFYKWLKETGEDSDRIRDAAGDKGSNVHHMTEQYDKGLQVSLLDESGKQTWSVQEWAMMARYAEFRQQVWSSMEINQIEMNVVDFDLGYAGTLDRLVNLKGKKMILDIKTSNAVYQSYWLQLAAYKALFEKQSGIAVDGVGIVWLNAKTRGTQPNKIQGNGWQLLTKDDTSDDMDLFNATRKLWLAQNKNVVPREISYQLTYENTTHSNSHQVAGVTEEKI